MATYDRNTLRDIRALKPWELARLADTRADNDDAESFLTGIRDSVLEATEYVDADDWERQLVDDYSGQAHEMADGAPSVCTHTLWQQFLGLQAYWEDPTEIGEPTDMNETAGVCLYLIASRLVSALAEMVNDGIRED